MTSMIRDMWNDDWVMRSVLLILFVTVAAVPIVVWLAFHEENQWKIFKEVHDCHVVGQTSGNVSTTVAPIIGGNGGMVVGTSYTSGQTGWKCDDGVTYWR